MSSNKIRDIGEQLASCPLGQALFKFADRILWTFERSVEWFTESEESKGPCIRPLPWILFLPFLLCLRFFKIIFAAISFVRGKETLPPTKVISCIQTYRRCLRGVKYTGLKNYTTWKNAQEEKRKADGECIIMKMLGLYWLSAYTGFGRLISPVPPSKVNQDKQLKPIADESFEATETEHTSKNVNQMCDQSTNDGDPDNKPSADKSVDNDNDDDSSSDSTDSSMSSDSSGMSSTLSLETAEAGSESTVQTFYSSSSITPEPTPHQAPIGNESVQSASVEEIPKQTSSGDERPQEQTKYIEQKEREELPSSQNVNVAKQVESVGKKSNEDSAHDQTSTLGNESNEPFSVEDESQTDSASTQILTGEQGPDQAQSAEEQQIDSSLQSTLPNTSHKIEQALEENSRIDLPPSQVSTSIEHIPNQSASVEGRTNPKQISSSVIEEQQNEQSVENNQQNNIQEINLNFQEEVKSKTNSGNIPQLEQSTDDKMQIDEAQLPNNENHSEGSEQKRSEAMIQKNSSDFVKGQSEPTHLEQKYDDCSLLEQKTKIKCQSDKDVKSNKKDKLTDELKRIQESVGLLYSLANYDMDFGNPNSDFIKSECSDSLPPFRKSDPAIGPTSSTDSEKEYTTKDSKRKRRFSDFFSSKKKTES